MKVCISNGWNLFKGLNEKLTVLLYDLKEKFPDKEKFGLTNKMRRASFSVGAYIAEGSSRFSAKEQAHFYSISYGNLMELMGHSFTSSDLKYLCKVEFKKIKSIV